MKKHLEAKNSGIHGKGLFAKKKIKKDTVLGFCEAKPSKKIGPYTLWLDNGKKVDVKCKLKYINHSKKPNVSYFDDLSVVALRTIKPGEELTHDYGDDWH